MSMCRVVALESLPHFSRHGVCHGHFSCECSDSTRSLLATGRETVTQIKISQQSYYLLEIM